MYCYQSHILVVGCEKLLHRYLLQMRLVIYLQCITTKEEVCLRERQKRIFYLIRDALSHDSHLLQKAYHFKIDQYETSKYKHKIQSTYFPI